MSCDIIIPVWNQPELTKSCIESIARNTQYPYHLIIIDNGSDEVTRKYLGSLKSRRDISVQIIRNEENVGFVKATNQGLRASTSPYVCLMNNDTLATDGWLEEMMSVLAANPDIGILNPSSNTFGQNHSVQMKQDAGRTQELFTARGFCMLIRKEVIEKIGILDEKYGMGYFEETDFCMRAQREGFKIARAKAAYVYHKEGASFDELLHKDSVFKANEKIFSEIWGRHPVRVGYFLNSMRSPDEVNDIAVKVARSGHQIFIFLTKKVPWPVKIDHINIKRRDLNPLFFRVAAIWTVLKRLKKKPFEVLVTNDRLLDCFFTATKALHKADVIMEGEIGLFMHGKMGQSRPE